jgi:transposase
MTQTGSPDRRERPYLHYVAATDTRRNHGIHVAPFERGEIGPDLFRHACLIASEPAALLKVLGNPTYRFKRIGLEAGPLSQWLFSALAEAELPVICVETRHMQAVLKAQINKTDRNDARGIAQMIRVGLYRPVHVKTLRS